MQDFVNTIVLVCAAIAALGSGVILAFAVCRGAFALLRLQSKSLPAPLVVKAATQTAEV